MAAIDIVRWNGKYFDSPNGPNGIFWEPEPPLISHVFRVGKFIVFVLPDPIDVLRESYLTVHNAMSGYFDWEHEPWTFDYVEGPRVSNDSDVRVRFRFADDRVLRFHDSRLFGSMRLGDTWPEVGPEVIRTANGHPNRPVITLPEFADRIWTDRRPVKQVLMDQSFVAGIGNIYANEACHLAAVDPHTPANRIPPTVIPSLLEALRCAVLHSIPQVEYSWLNVYRRSACGSCGRPVIRTEVAKRATFHCERCQTI